MKQRANPEEANMALQRHSPKILYGFFPFLISGLLLFGCAQKTAHPALEEARSAVQTARADPSVSRNASLELEKAEMALNKGEQLFQQNGDTVSIEHQAYLARQHAAIAQEIGDRRTAEATIEKASEERSKALAEARTAEAEYAREQTATAREQTATAREQTATARERTEELEAELAELQAVPQERGLVVTLGDVVFDVNKAQLKSGGLRTIDKLAAFLERYPDRRVTVEGFTDSTGSAEYNQSLSERRAQSVRDALVQKGIDPARVDTHGYGEEFPKASNETPAGRQLNRRVEVVISNGNHAAPPRAR
jgi:outer membrane protein OmpA-like peptidoglycan-associated protein